MGKMDQEVSFPEAFAEALTRWLPFLEGRALAVSEVDPFTPETMPKLPVAVVAVVSEAYDTNVMITTDYAVEIALPPKRKTRADGCETPYWTYIDYEMIRDRVFSGMQEFAGMQAVSTEIEADQQAVYISIRLRRQTRWCEPDLSPDDPCAPYLGEQEGPLFTVRSGPMEPPCEEEHPPECRCPTCWMDETEEEA